MMNSIAPPPGASNTDSIVRDNAGVECFMAYLRTLVEFLVSDIGDPTDVVASDFCVGAWQPVIRERLRKGRGRVNKELAHLMIIRGETWQKVQFDGTESSNRRCSAALWFCREFRGPFREF